MSRISQVVYEILWIVVKEIYHDFALYCRNILKIISVAWNFYEKFSESKGWLCRKKCATSLIKKKLGHIFQAFQLKLVCL